LPSLLEKAREKPRLVFLRSKASSDPDPSLGNELVNQLEAIRGDDDRVRCLVATGMTYNVEDQ